MHRFFHSIPGGLLAGLATAGVIGGIRVLLPRVKLPDPLSQEFQWRPALVGGALGGVTHSLLDAMFHSDVLLFYPASNSGPLQEIVSRETIHMGCLVAGVLGALILWLRLEKGTTG